MDPCQFGGRFWEEALENFLESGSVQISHENKLQGKGSQGIGVCEPPLGINCISLPPPFVARRHFWGGGGGGGCILWRTGQMPGLQKHHLSVRYQAFLERLAQGRKREKTKRNERKRERERERDRYIYIYIYMYGCGLVCRRSFIVKSGQKEMLQICPISLFTFLTKIDQKRPETVVPSISLEKETLGLQSQAFLLVHLGFKIYFVCLFGKKRFKSQKC